MFLDQLKSTRAQEKEKIERNKYLKRELMIIWKRCNTKVILNNNGALGVKELKGLGKSAESKSFKGINPNIVSGILQKV